MTMVPKEEGPILNGLRAKLEKALALANTHTLADVVDALRSGSARIWHDGESVVVTEIVDYPRCRVLRFWLAAGHMDSVREMARDAEANGREQGCTRALFTGRRGWKRSPLVSEDGWRPTLQLFEKEL